MQITDLVGQTKQLLTQQTENPTNTKTVGQAISLLQELAVGEIFEGTVLSVLGKKVTLALSDGQHLSAKLDEKTVIREGKSMFFQVKAHLENQIQIRPFTIAGKDANYTHVEAIKAAGLPVEAEYLSMVDKMMEEQMPIDRNHVGQMGKLVQLNPEVNPRTVVELTKLQLPLTKEVVTAFENYKADKQALGKELESLQREVVSFATAEDEDFFAMLGQSKKMIQIFLSDKPPVEKPGLIGNQQTQALQEQLGQILPQSQPKPREVVYQTIEQLLTQEQQVQLNDIMLHVIGFESEEDMQIQMMLRTDTSKDVLQEIAGLLENVNLDNTEKKDSIVRLLTSPQFERILKNVVENQWFLQPEELMKEENPIQKFFEHLRGQLQQLEEAIQESGPKAENLQMSIKQVQSNVEFMNQVNQMYSYVQIPLKMSGKNTSGELYVYRNRKNVVEADEELSAFLHLDMEHLGSTDVSVKMKNKQVDTKFYMEDDESFSLLEQFLPILQGKLERKGYSCKLSVVNEEKRVHMVEDFLKQDLPPSGQVRRYSFDMRA